MHASSEGLKSSSQVFAKHTLAVLRQKQASTIIRVLIIVTAAEIRWIRKWNTENNIPILITRYYKRGRDSETRNQRATYVKLSTIWRPKIQWSSGWKLDTQTYSIIRDKVLFIIFTPQLRYLREPISWPRARLRRWNKLVLIYFFKQRWDWWDREKIHRNSSWASCVRYFHRASLYTNGCCMTSWRLYTVPGTSLI